MYLFIKNKSQTDYSSQVRFPVNESEMERLIAMQQYALHSPMAIVESVREDEQMDALLKGKEVNLEELNHLCKRLDSFEWQDRNTFYAAASLTGAQTMKELINLSYNTACYNLVGDFSNLEQLDRLMANERGGAPQEPSEAITAQQYILNSLQSSAHSLVTPHGLIWQNSNTPEQIYDGKHLPLHYQKEELATIALEKDDAIEYLFLPYSMRQKEVALQKLGCASFEECELSILNNNLPQGVNKVFAIDSAPLASKLDMLNKVCESLTEIGRNEFEYLGQLMASVRPETPEEVALLLESCYDFTLYPNIHSAEQYGAYMICDSGHYEYDANLEAYIDFEGYGIDRLNRENGAFTELGYIVYNGYNQDLAQLLQRNLGLDALPSQNSELKIYMPLQGETYEIENDYGDYEYSNESEDISANELLQYQDEIERAITRYDENSMPERGLMEYYDKKDALNTKVHRLTFAVEAIEDELMGVATLTLKAPLEESELSTIKQYIEGTAADGWGEGFEQQEIYCDGRNINVSFWSSGHDWSLQTADELGIEEHEYQAPQMGMQM